MDYDVVPPDPAGTIESLRALGYTLQSAVADLVDNSIDARAQSIDVRFHWAGPDSYVAIVDDGIGMTESALVDAMALARRGPRSPRGVKDLGRFGMGLKTASFSQAALLAVWSKAENAEGFTRVWDLEHVVQSGAWQLKRSGDANTARIIKELSASIGASGTVVLWRRLTRMVDELLEVDGEQGQAHFLESVAQVEQHLAMTFGRFLSGRTSQKGYNFNLCVNGCPVAAWDPFMEASPSTLRRPVERLQADGAQVVVRPYVLPPKRRLTDDEYRLGAGPRGWLEQQGFYVYRNDRLIVPGDWLGLPNFRKDEKHSLARIAVDLPSSMDHLWAIDVKKASATPPLPLRGSLTRAGKATRAEAQRVLTARSRTTALTKSDDLSYVWRPERTGGDLRFRLNWQHPLVKEALRVSPDVRPVIRALLRFIEETVPVAAIRTMFDEGTDRDHQPFASTASSEVVDIAERIYAAYVSQGLTPSQAAKRLQHTPPFNEFEDLLERLNLK